MVCTEERDAFILCDERVFYAVVTGEVFVYKGFLFYTVVVLICIAGDGREPVAVILIGCVAV